MQINWQKLNIPILSLFLLGTLSLLACNTEKKESPYPKPEIKTIKVGAERLDLYLSSLENKRIGLVVNHSSLVGQNHLVDTLLNLKIQVTKIFAPEHGFRGDLANGESVENGVDKKTNLPILSLHGKHKKPTAEMLSDIDLVIFDIQDVGTRFFTYISTMHYVMEACAENEIPVMILDRPNPNGYYVDGPVMEDDHKSFLGMHSIPIVHGMTVGELAQMINGEFWLQDSLQCDLSIVEVENYDHSIRYKLPIRPSPNLPTALSVNLYPSLCLFEQTTMSIGRGTDHPFSMYGNPDFPDTTFSFLPKSRTESIYPKHEDMVCYGINLEGETELERFELKYLIDAYQQMSKPSNFFSKYFERLAGTEELEKQIIAGLTEEEIRKTWQDDLESFKILRKKYLIYKDFE